MFTVTPGRLQSCSAGSEEEDGEDVQEEEMQDEDEQDEEEEVAMEWTDLDRSRLVSFSGEGSRRVNNG